jgi:hypothetical protein
MGSKGAGRSSSLDEGEPLSRQKALERILEAKRIRRRELAQLPFEEKFRMVAEMGQLSRSIVHPSSSLICDAISRRSLLEFDYDGLHRIVQPYCHGTTGTGRESLRAIQIGGESRGSLIASGKLWTVAKMVEVKVSHQTFVPNDPHYNPNDTAMVSTHCRI